MNIIVNNKNGIETYGYPFADGLLQPHIELFAYALMRGNYGEYLEHKLLYPMGRCRTDFKFRSPVEHLINYVKMAWPTEVEIQVRQYINRPLLELWEELCNSDDVGVSGNASSGKTMGVSAWLDADWQAAPNVTSAYVASTSLTASMDRIWGTVLRLHKSSKFQIGHAVEYQKCIVLEDPGNDDARDYSNSIKALAFPPGSEGRKAVDTTRGRKNKRIRVVVDELAEMEAYVNNVRSNLAANDDFVYIGIANPLNGDNPHRTLCEPDHPKGYDSVSKASKRWKTKTGTAIFLSGERSPNFEAPETETPPFPYLLTRRKMARILEINHGNERALDYLRNAIGWWADDSVDTNIIQRAMITAANISFEPQWSGVKRRVAALDCALTSGGDRNELSYGFVAPVRGLNKSAMMYQGTKGYSISSGTVFEDDLASQVVADLIEVGISPEDFGIDVDGAGGKVLSAIIKEWLKFDPRAADIVPLSSMGNPTDRIISSDDKRLASDVYDRRITEAWWAVHTALATRSIYGISLEEHPELITELCARKYTYKNKKISVETKRDMKARMGRSPDKADSLVMLVEMGRKRGLSFIDNDKEGLRDKHDDVVSRADVDYNYSGDGSDPDGF